MHRIRDWWLLLPTLLPRIIARMLFLVPGRLAIILRAVAMSPRLEKPGLALQVLLKPHLLALASQDAKPANVALLLPLASLQEKGWRVRIPGLAHLSALENRALPAWDAAALAREGTRLAILLSRAVACKHWMGVLVTMLVPVRTTTMKKAILHTLYEPQVAMMLVVLLRVVIAVARAIPIRQSLADASEACRAIREIIETLAGGEKWLELIGQRMAPFGTNACKE